MKISACMTATLFSINFNFFYESDIILIDVAFFGFFSNFLTIFMIFNFQISSAKLIDEA